MRKNSIKNTRINAAVREELSRIIRYELTDPRIALMTSVTSVSVAPDLKTCRVSVSVLGNEQEKEDPMAGLQSAVGYIRRLLAQGLNLRNTPELTFIPDGSIEYGVRMSKVIDEVVSRDEAAAALRPPEEPETAEGSDTEETDL